jgi:transcriptional regulator with XRE-family HTH domain
MLNVALISRRRIDLGLSRHDLARASGLSWRALLELEASSWTDGSHTLTTLRALAGALGLEPADLLEQSNGAVPADPDAKIVGAVLAQHPPGLHDAVLARTLGWPAPRVRDALHALAEQLPSIGQTLRQLHGHNQLTPAHTSLDTEQLEELARTCGPFDPDHARTLLKILRRNKRDNRWQNFTPAEHDCLLDLIAQGAIGDERDAIYPTASVREALRLGYDRAGRDFPADSRFLPSRREDPPLTRR